MQYAICIAKKIAHPSQREGIDGLSEGDMPQTSVIGK